MILGDPGSQDLNIKSPVWAGTVFEFFCHWMCSFPGSLILKFCLQTISLLPLSWRRLKSKPIWRDQEMEENKGQIMMSWKKANSISIQSMNPLRFWKGNGCNFHTHIVSRGSEYRTGGSISSHCLKILAAVAGQLLPTQLLKHKLFYKGLCSTDCEKKIVSLFAIIQLWLYISCAGYTQSWAPKIQNECSKHVV